MGIGVATREQLAWAAGLFEGEGCVGFYGGKQPVASISSTDRDVVERFRDIFGFGTIRTKPRQAPWKDCHDWRVTNFEHVQVVIAALWPWLLTRRQAKAEEVLRSKRTRINSRKVA